MMIEVLIIIALMVGIYTVIRNLDIIRIILNYWKDLIFRK